MLAPCEAYEEGRGEVIVRKIWCYGEEGIKESAQGLESRTQKEQGLREKRGINRNREAEKQEKKTGCSNKGSKSTG